MRKGLTASVLGVTLTLPSTIQANRLQADNEWEAGMLDNYAGNEQKNPRYPFRTTASGTVKIDLNSNFGVNSVFVRLFLASDEHGNNIMRMASDKEAYDRIPSIPSSDDSPNDPWRSVITVNDLDSGQVYWVIAAPRYSEFAAQEKRFHLELTGPVLATREPTIAQHPSAVVSPERSAAVFTVASTSLINGFQWKKNGVTLDGAVSKAFNILSVIAADQAEYTCEVKADGFSTLSDPAALTVKRFRPSRNGWRQERFVIGGTFHPELTGIPSQDCKAYEKMRRAHFNLVHGPVPVRPMSPAEEQVAALTTFDDPGPSNLYRLKIISKVPGLRATALDFRIAPAEHHYDPDNISDAAQDYEGVLNHLELRRHLFGYEIADEPWYLNDENSSAQFCTGVQLHKLEQLADEDRTKPGWINFRAAFGFRGDFGEYEEFVNTFALNIETKIISFDYYVLMKSGGFLGYFGMPDGPVFGRVSYYRHHEVFAQSVNLAKKVLGKRLYFWSFGATAEHRIDDNGDGDFEDTERHIVLPDASQLRFMGFVPLLYGAKGIIWYTYGLPGSGGGQEYLVSPAGERTRHGVRETPRSRALYRDLSRVNRDLENMGLTLMSLEWITTIHGTETDPYSGEPGLPTLGSGPTVFAPEPPIPENYAIGILRHAFTGATHLLILNKNITNPVTNAKECPTPDRPATSCPGTHTFSVLGRLKPYRWDKVSLRWIPLAHTASEARTSFTVMTRSGDMEMIRLIKPKPFRHPVQ